MAYGKDMQEDKEPVFDAEANLMLAITAMTGMIADMTANAEAMAEALKAGHPTATDLADFMVRELAMPFRDAHHASGSIVALADQKGCGLEELSFDDMVASRTTADKRCHGRFICEGAAMARTSFGGTAPEEVVAKLPAREKL